MSMQSRPGGGRVVLLTGAAGGIGTAITQALLGDGHFVAAVDKSESALSRLSLVCGRSDVSERLCPILADLADAAACLDAVAAAAARFGRVDAVINNAGIGVSSLRPDAELRHPAIEEPVPDLRPGTGRGRCMAGGETRLNRARASSGRFPNPIC